MIIMTRLAVASLLMLAACGPAYTPPPGPPPPPAADMAPSVDLMEAPRLISVAPTLVHGGSTDLTVTAVGLDLTKVQAGIWSFGVCPVDAYTYTPISPGSCRLRVQIGVASPLSCDLTLRIANKDAAPTLVGAFGLAP